nr:MAK10-like protein [Tanacetum cinerariifolium]
MGDENPIRTLRDYSKPIHEGYRNTTELPLGKNMVPLRSDTIRLVQNGCSFHRLQSEDPNQHLKDFLKFVDSLDLDGENRERTRLTTKSPSSWHRPLALSPNFYDHVNLVTRRTIDQSAGGNRFSLRCPEYIRPLSNRARKSSPTLDGSSSCSDTTYPVNKITTLCEICSGPHDTQYCMKDPEQAFVEYASSRTDEAGGKHGSAFIQGEVPTKMEDPGLFTLPCRLGDSKPFDTLADLGSCVNIIPLYLFKKLNIRLLEETDHIFRLADRTKSYPVGIVKDVEVHIGKLKLLNDFYMIDIKKDPETPLLVGTGLLAIANAVIDCRMAKITIGEGITRSVFEVKRVDLGARTPYYARKDFLDCYLLGEWEIARDVELNPFKDTLVLRRMDKPPKNEDGTWHAKIRLINPDREEFTKTLQSIPTTRKLSERESPMEIIDLDHFYDT